MIVKIILCILKLTFEITVCVRARLQEECVRFHVPKSIATLFIWKIPVKLLLSDIIFERHVSLMFN